MRDCNVIAFKGKEGKEDAPSVPKENAPINRRFCAVPTGREKLDESDDDVCKFSFCCCDMSSF